MIKGEFYGSFMRNKNNVGRAHVRVTQQKIGRNDQPIKLNYSKFVLVKIHVQNSKAGNAAVKEKLSKKMGRDKNERIIS